MNNRERLLELLKYFRDCGYDPRPYSGTAMQGGQCLGVACQNPTECVMDVIREECRVRHLATDVAELMDYIGAVRMDSMGIDQIVYFPDVEWYDEPEEFDSE